MSVPTSTFPPWRRHQHSKLTRHLHYTADITSQSFNEIVQLTTDSSGAAMCIALKQLGYVDTYHMKSVIENPMDCQMWIEALEAKYFGKGKPFEREDWDQLLGHCQVRSLA